MGRTGAVIRGGILALFFVSGAPALLYQVVWQRHLFTIFGAHAESVSIIVGAFMLGLGLGSLIGGEVSARTKLSPFVLFAIVECLIAVFGIFSLGLFDAVGNATATFGLFGGAVASFLLVVLPTVAKGATLPILANALIARVGNVGVSVGQLYFVNTLGSAFAAFGSRYLFAHGFGQRGTVLFSAALNGVVVLGALLLWLATRGAPSAPSAAAVAAPEAFTRDHLQAALLSFCSGFLALSVELTWFRIVFLFTRGRAYAFPLALSYFLLGIALGSLLAARLMRSWAAEPRSQLRARAARILLIAGATISLVFVSSGYLVAHLPGMVVLGATAVLALGSRRTQSSPTTT